MFISPYFGGCKYTNNFLFINKNIVFQHFGLLITQSLYLTSSSHRHLYAIHCNLNCVKIVEIIPSGNFLKDFVTDAPKSTAFEQKTYASVSFMTIFMTDGLNNNIFIRKMTTIRISLIDLFKIS